MAAAIDLRSDVLSIVRRSSTIFFSTSVVVPLVLSAASLLLVLFRSLILYLTFRCTASLMKHNDSIVQPILFLFFGFAFFAYFILAAALHFTALLTVLSSLLNRPPPTAGSYMAAIRNERLFAFHKTLLMSTLVEQACALFLFTCLAGAPGGDVSSVLSVVMEKTRLGLSPFPTLDDVVVGQYPVVLIATCSVVLSMVSIVVVNLAPLAVLFLGPADERRRNMGVLWYAVKQGCYLMFLLSFQAMAIKMVEEWACDVLSRKGSMAIINMAAGDWRGLFVVLVVKSVAEAFFVVVWLVFYVAARGRAAAEIGGEAFGMQDLDNCLARLR